MISKVIPNDNIVKLKELTKQFNLTEEDGYEKIVRELKKIIDEGKADIETIQNAETKMTCYESMCQKITTILNKVKA